MSLDSGNEGCVVHVDSGNAGCVVGLDFLLWQVLKGFERVGVLCFTQAYNSSIECTPLYIQCLETTHPL